MRIVNVQVVSRIFRGYSLIGKTTILHIVISGSLPDISNALEAQLAEQGFEGALVVSSNLT